MKVIIVYERLFNDGSRIDIDSYVFYIDEWNISKIPNIIAKFYKTIIGNLKILSIHIDRD